MIDTNETLLERVKRLDAQEAWREFYNAYWSAILRYARKLGLSDHQAEEVLQETMVALMRQLPDFDYDPQRGRFRNYLLTIVHRRSLAALRRARRAAEMTGSASPHAVPVANPSDALPGESSAEDRVSQELWQEAIMEDALERMANNPALADGTYAAFHAYAIEGRPAAEVAAEFGIKENALYQIKNRLMRRLRADVARRLREAGSSQEPA